MPTTGWHTDTGTKIPKAEKAGCRANAPTSLWPWVERRIHKAELLVSCLAQGTGNSKTLWMTLQQFDYMTERNFEAAERAEYVKIVDVLSSPLHFSRKELIVRADPSNTIRIIRTSGTIRPLRALQNYFRAREK